MIFQAIDSELDNVLAWVEKTLEEAMASPKVVMPFLVAVEEIFVNVAHYAYRGKEGSVEIEFLVDDKAKITFIDEGIPFDPLAKPDPDVTASADERQIGGLGIYMVKKSMDGVEYHRVGDKNIFSFWKNL